MLRNGTNGSVLPLARTPRSDTHGSGGVNSTVRQLAQALPRELAELARRGSRPRTSRPPGARIHDVSVDQIANFLRDQNDPDAMTTARGYYQKYAAKGKGGWTALDSKLRKKYGSSPFSLTG